jgi:hypothetical protein
VGKTLNYLVVGASDRGGLSTKEKAARKLKEEGHPIEVLGEREFEQLLRQAEEQGEERGVELLVQEAAGAGVEATGGEVLLERSGGVAEARPGKGKKVKAKAEEAGELEKLMVSGRKEELGRSGEASKPRVVQEKDGIVKEDKNGQLRLF